MDVCFTDRSLNKYKNQGMKKTTNTNARGELCLGLSVADPIKEVNVNLFTLYCGFYIKLPEYFTEYSK